MFYKNVNQFHYFPIVIIQSLYWYMYEVNHIKHRFTPIYQKATYVHVTTKISQKMSAYLQMANYFWWRIDKHTFWRNNLQSYV